MLQITCCGGNSVTDQVVLLLLDPFPPPHAQRLPLLPPLLQPLSSIEEGQAVPNGAHVPNVTGAATPQPSTEPLPLAISMALSSGGVSELNFSTFHPSLSTAANGDQQEPGVSPGLDRLGAMPQLQMPGAQEALGARQWGRLASRERQGSGEWQGSRERQGSGPSRERQGSEPCSSDEGLPLANAATLEAKRAKLMTKCPSASASPGSGRGDERTHSLPRKQPTWGGALGSTRPAFRSSEDYGAGSQPLRRLVSGSCSGGGGRLSGAVRGTAVRNLDGSLSSSQVLHSLPAFLSSGSSTRNNLANQEVSGAPSVSMRALKLSLLIDPYPASHTPSASSNAPLSGGPSAGRRNQSAPQQETHEGGAAAGVHPASPPALLQGRLSRCSEQLRKTPSLPSSTFATMVAERAASGSGGGLMRRIATGPLNPVPAAWSRAPSSLRPTGSQQRLQLPLDSTVSAATSPRLRQLASGQDSGLAEIAAILDPLDEMAADHQHLDDRAVQMPTSPRRRQQAPPPSHSPLDMGPLGALPRHAGQGQVLSEWLSILATNGDAWSDSSGSQWSSLDGEGQQEEEEEEGQEEEAEDRGARWHQVQVVPVTDPVTGRKVRMAGWATWDMAFTHSHKGSVVVCHGEQVLPLLNRAVA